IDPGKIVRNWLSPAQGAPLGHIGSTMTPDSEGRLEIGRFKYRKQRIFAEGLYNRDAARAAKRSNAP
ncbi:hypothetical protein KI387_018619, partial [Taxus chinensis]